MIQKEWRSYAANIVSLNIVGQRPQSALRSHCARICFNYHPEIGKVHFLEKRRCRGEEPQTRYAQG